MLCGSAADALSLNNPAASAPKLARSSSSSIGSAVAASAVGEAVSATVSNVLQSE